MSFYRNRKLYADDIRPKNGVLTPDVPLPGTHFRGEDGHIYEAIHKHTPTFFGMVEHDTGSDLFGFNDSYRRSPSSLCSPRRRSASPRLVAEASGHSVYAAPADTRRKLIYKQEVDARAAKIWHSPSKPPWEGENATYAATLKAKTPDWLMDTQIDIAASPADRFRALVNAYKELESANAPPPAVSPLATTHRHAPSASPTPVSVGHGTPLATRAKINTPRAKSPDYWWAMKMGIGASPTPKPVAMSEHVQLELKPVDPVQPETEHPATTQSVSARRPPRRRKRRPGHRYHPRTRRAPQRYTQPSSPYGDTPIPVFIPQRKTTGHTVSTPSPQFDNAEVSVPGW